MEIAAENSRLSAWMNRTPALLVNIQRQPGANVIQVVDSIKQLLPSLTATLPQAITITPLTDRTITIRASVSDVEFELSLSIGLVVLVIFLFLRNVPATIIPSLAVPLSLVGALAIMYQLGFSLDNLSLMALTIATGFVVDDAIVVIENIARYLEGGDSPNEAALKGSQQIGFTIISLTVSLLAVLIPLLFMGDVVGRLFHEFAITLAATIVISAIVSLTLTPMMCAKLLRAEAGARSGRHHATGGRFFQALLAWYGRALDVVLNHQPTTLLVALATFVLTGYLYATIPKGFFPLQDTGIIQAVTQAAEDTSFDKMADRQQQLADVILRDPDVDSLSSFIGVDGSNVTLNSGRFLINLKPHDQRTADVAEVIRRLQRETANVAGIALYMQPVQDLSIETQVSATEYQFTLDNQDLATLQSLDAEGARPPRQSRRDRRRRQRPAAERPRGAGDDRSVERGALRHHPGDGRQRALRRLRPAHHFDRLHPVEPVPRHSRHRPGDDAFGRLARQHLSAVVRLDLGPGAAVGDRVARRHAGAAADFASQAVSGDDDLVQPRARRLARRRRRRDQRRARRHRLCRRASASTSRARRRRSRRRCRTRRSCCWRRS